MIEKRKFLRIAVQRPVQLVLSSGETVFATMTNISNEGMGILYKLPADAGLNIGVNFTLPQEQARKALALDTAVAHCHVAGDNYYIGLKFINLNREQKSLLWEFIYRKQTQYIPAA